MTRPLLALAARSGCLPAAVTTRSHLHAAPSERGRPWIWPSRRRPWSPQRGRGRIQSPPPPPVAAEEGVTPDLAAPPSSVVVAEGAGSDPSASPLPVAVARGAYPPTRWIRPIAGRRGGLPAGSATPQGGEATSGRARPPTR